MSSPDGGDEDVHHLGRADAVDDADARSPSCQACQVAAGRCSPAETQVRERGDVVPVQQREHRLVGGRARWRGRDLVAGDRRRAAASGPGVSIVTAVPPKRQGKISSMPSPKVKAIGAEQAQRSPGSRLQDVAGEAVGRGEDVAVIMDAALGLAGRARGEGDQGDVVAARCRPARSRARSSSRPSKPLSPS